jgi:shikimate kinase
VVSLKRLKIFLIGFSGSGKTTVGAKLAKKMRLAYFDTDDMIERRAGQHIADIFARSGERRFRRLESEMIERICSHDVPPCVVALGGGAFGSSANRKRLLRSGIVIYLSASVRAIYRRLEAQTDRPLLKVRPRANETLRQARLARISSLLQKRKPNYGRAHIRCSTTEKPTTQIVNELIRQIRRHVAHNC